MICQSLKKILNNSLTLQCTEEDNTEERNTPVPHAWKHPGRRREDGPQHESGV